VWKAKLFTPPSLMKRFLIKSLPILLLSFVLLGLVPSGTGEVGEIFFAVTRTNIAAVSVNLPFGFSSAIVGISTPSTNTDDICIDWIGGTAVCPAANTAGDDLIPASTSVILDNYGVSSISVIAASGTQTISIRAWR